MKNFILVFLLVTSLAQTLMAAARVMNPGEAIGQLIVLSSEDVLTETPKYKSLSPLSIPVFPELPMDMSLVAGAITLKQQNLLSHVQLKSRARGTPNLDISELEGGLQNPLLSSFADGAWIHMTLTAAGEITIVPSTEAAAEAFYASKLRDPVTLQSDLTAQNIFSTEELTSADFVRVGSKSANYGELARLLNTRERTIVRPGYGIPFYYYEEFVNGNPQIRRMITNLLRDPLMRDISAVRYRENKLRILQELMTNPAAVVNDALVTDLISRFDTMLTADGKKRKIKLRSSTNSEDLPNFNGAGLYTSDSYNPLRAGVEKTTEEKRDTLKAVLRTVWASVWNLRAWDERNFFQIPHDQVKMGIQVNPAFGNEIADGVVVTKNVARAPGESELGVYIEVQRGDKHSVANPEAGVSPQKVLVMYDAGSPLNVSAYQIQVLQSSNIADDNETVLPQANPVPVMTDAEIKDLTLQVLKAKLHFGPLLDAGNADFALDLEFKVDAEDNGRRQVYLKQSRPYID